MYDKVVATATLDADGMAAVEAVVAFLRVIEFSSGYFFQLACPDAVAMVEQIVKEVAARDAND